MFDTVSISFILFLLIFTFIGIYSSSRSQKTTDDYLLASRSVSPWLMALSAVATNNSGFMFIGMIGFTYAYGISSIWIMVGWIIGDYMAWRWFYRGVRIRSERCGAQTVPSFIGAGSLHKNNRLISITGIVTIVFLGAYAAAQFSAGSKALHVLFGWDYSVGAIIGATLVFIYCFSGGIRASIWTDAAQSIVMILSMSIMLFMSLHYTGGFKGLFVHLRDIDPVLLRIIPPDLKFGFTAYLLSWLCAGIGVIGQPHVLIRAMAINSGKHLHKARRIYFGWYILFTIIVIFVGLVARVLIPELNEFDPELALPQLAFKLLPGVFVGLVLAGLFAATMSTADSQILSCSASLTKDIFPDWKSSYLKTKLGTLIVTIVALTISLKAGSSVFALVTVSWSALAAAIGPLVIFRTIGVMVRPACSFWMIGAGLATVFVWHFVLNLSYSVLEVLPAMTASFLVYLGFRVKEGKIFSALLKPNQDLTSR